MESQKSIDDGSMYPVVNRFIRVGACA